MFSKSFVIKTGFLELVTDKLRVVIESHNIEVSSVSFLQYGINSKFKNIDLIIYSAKENLRILIFQTLVLFQVEVSFCCASVIFWL